MLDPLRDGLAITDFEGGNARVRPMLATTPSAAANASLVLVTVKSAQTAEAASALSGVLASDAVVVSFQNGVRNAEVLRAGLPNHRVLAAMVPFNVTRKPIAGSATDAFHRASGGILRVDDDRANAELLAACLRANLPIEPRPDMPAVQWAKLVMNLNNAINALSGLTLVNELSDRGFRRCVAAAQREALELLAVAKQPIAKLTAIPPGWMPRLLSLPDAVFSRLARRVVAIDPHARSSMWDDLESRRPTEIDYLQGEVVALAAKHGRSAPVNAKLVELVRAAETGGKHDFTAPQLQAALGV